MNDGTKLIFNSLEELLEARPNVDLSSSIDLELYKNITANDIKAKYQFPNTVTCQRLIKNEKCNQPHQNGWVVSKRDGVEVLIGKDCVHKNIPEDILAMINKSTRNIDAQIELQNRQKVVQELLRRTSMSEIENCHKSLKEYSEKRTSFEESIAGAIFQKVENMIKSGDSLVYIQVQREQGSVRNWEEFRLGRITGILWLDKRRLNELMTKCWRALKVHKEADPLSKDLKLLKGWSLDLEGIYLVSGRLSEIKQLHEIFMSKQNVALISALHPNEDNRLSVITYFKENGLVDLDPRSYLRKLDKEFREASGCANIRFFS